MNKAIKWLLITLGVLVALVIAALLVIPMFVDMQKYKPAIEKRVSEATGRPFAIGGDLNLSLFPWVGISFSDLQLGNPPGFEEKDFVKVKSFEVRVKLLPLISKDIQVERFVLEGPRIVLEKNKKGRANWEGLGKPSEKAQPTKEKKEAPSGEAGEGLPIKSLVVGTFAITKGSLLWINHPKGERKELSDLDLRLLDVSLDRPIQLALSASLDGKPLSVTGKLGPLGKEPGKGTMLLDFSIKALQQLAMDLKGQIVDPATRQEFDLAIEVATFSPRKLVNGLGQDFPVKTADPDVLKTVALKVKVKGNPKSVSVSEGALELDGSKLDFSAKARDFARPDVVFDLDLDKIDLDRYLPPPSEKKAGTGEEKAEASPPAKKKTDYTPLRKLILDGTIKIGELTVKGAKLEDLLLKVSGRNGLFRLDPLTLKLYQGNVSSKTALDVRRDTLTTDITLEGQAIQVNPLLKDVLKKDFLEGTVEAKVDIAMVGDDATKIKSTLNGKGDFRFADGAIVGIDLPGMVRNVQATFGLAEKGGERPRTDFSELHSPFTLRDGVFDTRETSLTSPALRVLAAGKADLLRETLDFRVEPKFVATLKGQGDEAQYSGVEVPVLVTGSFSSPRFRPDLEGMLKQRIGKELPQASELKKMLPSQETQTGQPQPPEKKVKELLKGLPFGQ
jgi:AsmA protein